MKKASWRSGLIFLYLALFSGLLYWRSDGFLLTGLRNFGQRRLARMEEKLFTRGQEFRDFFSHSKADQEEVARLKEELAILKGARGKLGLCLQQIEADRRLLGAPLPPQWSFIPTKPLAFFENLRIDAGSKVGIKMGMMVIYENWLIGRISGVEDYSSSVTLVTSPNFKIPVLIRKPQDPKVTAQGLVSGFSRQQLLLSQVLKNEGIAPGDLVYTQGSNDWLPDLLIGEIAKSEADKDKVFTKAWVNLPYQVENLRNLFVVRRGE
ncbi:rod shape-determining protein MreC [Patescibacteria group bacterium]